MSKHVYSWEVGLGELGEPTHNILRVVIISNWSSHSTSKELQHRSHAWGENLCRISLDHSMDPSICATFDLIVRSIWLLIGLALHFYSPNLNYKITSRTSNLQSAHHNSTHLWTNSAGPSIGMHSSFIIIEVSVVHSSLFPASTILLAVVAAHHSHLCIHVKSFKSCCC